MLYKFFVFISSFFGLLAVFSVLTGYAGILTVPISHLVFVLSILIAYFLTKKTEKKTVSCFKQAFLVLGVLLASFYVFFFVLVQDNDFVYPLTCTDFMSHANNSRLTAQKERIDWQAFSKTENPLPFSHSYPQIFYGVTAIIYNVFGRPNIHFLVSVMAVFFYLMSGLGVFLSSIQLWKNFKPAFFSLFVWQFFITNFFLIDSGFIPQIAGTFFLISAFLQHLTNKNINFVLSLAGLALYPHLAGVFFAYLLLKSFFSKNFIQTLVIELVYPLTAVFLVFPEVLGFFFEFMEANRFRENLALIKGGTIFPNLLAFPLMFFGFIGLLLFAKKNDFFKKKYKNVLLNNNAILLFAAFMLTELGLVFSWVANLFLRFTIVSIYQFYMPAKLFFSALMPLSLLSGKGLAIISEKNKILLLIAIILSVYHFAYFFGFTGTVLNRNAFSKGYYDAVNYLSFLPENSTVSVDPEIVELQFWGSPKFPYQSLYDNPDPYKKNFCAVQEVAWDLTFPWAKQVFLDDRPGREIVNQKNQQVVFIDTNSGEYLLTDKILNQKTVFKSGNYFVYRRQKN